MITKFKMSNRVMSAVIVLALLFGMIPFTRNNISAAEIEASIVADSSTIDQWKDYFPVSGDLTTQNAGGVWTDKSVFTAGTTIDGNAFSITGDNNFLVALSAIGSNMTVTGMKQVPTDVIFVLDVSGSMSDDNNNAAQSLVNATNASIKSLLAANEHSRVGVIMYSGPSQTGNGSLENASVILPLNTYETENTSGDYLVYNKSNNGDESIRVNEGVYSYVTTTNWWGETVTRRQEARQNSKYVVGGTYVQAGLALAEDEFLEASTTVTVDGVGTLDRMPAIVLMSDGAVSLATDDFHNPGTSNMGNGSEQTTTYDMGFVTQLTASHTKYKVSSHYGTDCLFYTLGLLNPNHVVSSVGTNWSDEQVAAKTQLVKNVANAVLDPGNSAENTAVDFSELTKRWAAYKATAASEYYNLSDHSDREVLRVSDEELAKMPMNYVNRFFDANKYTSATGGSLSDALAKAFEAIVSEIALQAVYHPTLVEDGSADLSGYISFVDKLGDYMKVSDVKGLMSGGTLFTGEKLAKSFYDAFSNGGGDLGSGMGAGTALGVAFMDALTTRLGVTRDTAFSILQNAWKSGNISYDPASGAYSNWFGWVSNASGAYIQPWNETDNGMGTNYHVIPPNAAYINRSYIFLGTEGDTDMMYATVRVREKVVNGVATGEQEVNFAIPASLLPTITYNVDLNEAGETTNITVDADTPVHLVYEAGLDPEINRFNVKDKVSADYLEKNTDDKGNILFYTNAWQRDGSTGYNKVNTYSYFRPSQHNDRYYYQSDSLVYTSTSGTRYTGATHPAETASGEYYYYYTYYAKTGSSYKTMSEYHVIPKDVLSVAVANGDGSWTIKAGTIRSDYANTDAPEITKASNATGTLSFSHEPFADTNSHAWDDTSHSSVVGATLANNGRMALTPDTGIRLTKNLAADSTPAEGEVPEFTFDVEYVGQNAPLDAFAYRFVNGVLTGEMETVSFTDGKATVTLKAGETLYIGGMSTGQVTVTEHTTADYSVQSVSVSGTPQIGDTATVTLAAGDMKNIDFVNSARKTGILNVAKAVIAPTGVNSTAISELSFSVNINLMQNGAPLANFTVNNSLGQPYGTTDAQGNLPITLSDGTQVTLYNIPDGTVATVAENTASLPAGFSKTPVYWENGVRDLDGVVTVTSAAITDIMISNYYTPDPVTASLNISLDKDFFVMAEGAKIAVPITGDDSYTFTFTLQSRELNTDTWNTLDTATVTYNSTTSASDIIRQTSDAFADMLQDMSYSEAGIYRYRIIETLGTEGHIIYDERTHSFGVEVADNNADGKWEIVVARTSTPDVVSITEGADGYDVNVLFENEYNVTVGTSAVIEINKSVYDPANVRYSPAGRELAEGFEFMVYQHDGVTPANGVTAQMTNTGGVTRFTMTYSENVFDQFGAGTTTHAFNYVVKELGTAGAGWTYAAPQYVTVIVSLGNDGALEAVAYLNDAAFSLQPGAGDTDNLVSVPFTNSYIPSTAELSLDFVNKQITGREFNINDRFEFKLAGTNGSVIYSSDGVTPLAGNALTGYATATSGSLTSVIFGDSLYFGKVGTYYYEITETSASGGGITADKTVHHVTVDVTDNGNGALSASYNVTSVVGNEITFVNTYSATYTSLTLTGTKTLTGRPINENDFQFVLTRTDVSPNQVWYAANTGSGTGSSSFTFPSLTYTAPGTYTYTVSEYDPTAALSGYYDGVVYDKTVYDVTVTVTDNGSGTLSASHTVSLGGAAAPNGLAFENHYAPAPTRATISGIKDILGRGITEDDKFTFELYNASFNEVTGTWVKGSLKEAVQNRGGAITFSPIVFTEAGEYFYMVSEKQESAGGITYDTTTWRVVVTVTDNGNGVLSREVAYLNDSGRQNAMVFLNRYSTAGGFIDLTGHKTLTGKTLLNGQFEFDLYETDSSFTVSDSAQRKLYARNVADGSFSLRLSYTSADIGSTYYYVVQEQNAGKTHNGITYSDNRYHITVTVEDNGDGTLKITPVITLGGTAVTSLDFTNSYSVSSGSLTLEGTKELLGRPMFSDDKFTFELYRAEGDSFTKVGEPESVQNGVNGSFSFAPITYTTEGVYRYVVVEKAGAANLGITYDNSEWNILVVVADNGRGSLAPTVTYMKNGVAQSSLVFTNTYAAAAGSIVLEGTKTLTGKALAGNDFTFEVYLTDSSFAVAEGQAPADTFKNNANGELKYAMSYAKYDIGSTYYYVIREQNAGKTINGITYSDREYRVTVNVTDNLDGTLKITPVITLDGTAVTSLDFTNEYSTESTSVTVEGTKELIGRPLTEGDSFTFELTPAEGGESVTAQNGADGSFSFAPITYTAPGTYRYVVVEKAGGNDIGITYDTTEWSVLVEVNDNGLGALVPTVTYIKNGEAQDAMVFTNTYAAVDGFITVEGTKELVNKTLTEGQFEFDLYETDSSFVIAAGAERKSFATNDAEGRFSLRLGYTKDDIGKTFYYVIQEQNSGKKINGITYSGSKYLVTVTVEDNLDGTLKITPVITLDGTAVTSLAFTNEYSTSDASVTVEGVKEMVGRPLTEGDSFTFELTPAEGGESVTAQNGADGAFSFAPITYTEVGTYSYTVVEKAGDESLGITYDATEWKVIVDVVDNGLGALVPTVTYMKGDEAQDVMVFTNTYTAAEASVTLEGKKELLGRPLTADDKFTFELYAAEGASFIKAGESVSAQNAEDGTVKFAPITYTAPGTYHYVIVEKAGDESIGITYDKAEWNVTVEVIDNGVGALVPTVTYMKDGTAQSEMVFTNTYSAADGSFVLEGTKTLTGKDIAGHVFTFDIYQTDSTFTLENGQPPAGIFQSNANGELKHIFNYAKDDIGKTYYYVIREQNAGEVINGVTYSTGEYHITVTVEDNFDGTLRITPVITLDGNTVTSVDFTNEYSAGEISVTVEGNKELLGRPLTEDDKFTFELTPAEGGESMTAQNGADGSFSFAPITYTAPGTYNYVVVEKAGDESIGITYDTTEWKVIVDVVDNGIGALVPTVTYMKGDEAQSAMVFTNTYAAASGSLYVEGNKILTGRDLRNEEFLFELYKANESFEIEGDALSSAKNNADGKFSFAVEYTKDDAGKTFCYVIKEANNGLNGIIYSTDEYRVTVSVVDDGRGNLTITPTMTLDGEVIDAVRFINEYSDSATAEVEITKTVNNLGSEKVTPEGFEFLLERADLAEAVKVISDADGKAAITLSFTAADNGKTYTYRLTEIAGDMENMTYDSTVYSFTVSVSIGENDELIATVTVGEEVVDTLKAEFVNTYDFTPDIPDEPDDPEIPDEPDDPEIPDDPNEPDAPQTSDSFNMMLWLTVVLLSGLGITATVKLGKKRHS